MSNPQRVVFSLSASAQDREDTMSDEVFKGFQRVALEKTGIQLAANKRAMIVNRFGRRLDALGLTCFEEYLELVSDASSAETSEFIDTVTTNLTYFFREPHHFDVLAGLVLPKLASRTTKPSPLRIWSAGCSSGAEPYSIAMVVKETQATCERPVRILCTDIDTKMVEATFSGNYSEEQMRGLDESRKKRWFNLLSSGRYQADQQLRSMLICKQLNLFGTWPFKSGVDVIICRNVLIYFSPDYQKQLLVNFSKMQSTGSYLFMGHSETLDGFKDTYRRVDNTVYERI